MPQHRDDRWWEHYFDQAFLRAYRPLLPAERSWLEVAAAVEVLDLPSGASILDLGCGWGRHALDLARLGYRVVGLDLSEALLRTAVADAAAAGVHVAWVRAEMRQPPFHGCFDAALSLFSSLGYFGSEAEDLNALRAAREALRPGGLLLLETMHRDLIARDFIERDWWEGDDGDHVWVEREFDAIAGVSRERLRWRAADGEAGEKFHEIRIRAAPEWDRLLREVELEPLEWFGGWELGEFTHESERLIVLARRRD